MRSNRKRAKKKAHRRRLSEVSFCALALAGDAASDGFVLDVVTMKESFENVNRVFAMPSDLDRPTKRKGFKRLQVATVSAPTTGKALDLSTSC